MTTGNEINGRLILAAKDDGDIGGVRTDIAQGADVHAVNSSDCENKNQ